MLKAGTDAAFDSGALVLNCCLAHRVGFPELRLLQGCLFFVFALRDLWPLWPLRWRFALSGLNKTHRHESTSPVRSGNRGELLVDGRESAAAGSIGGAWWTLA